MKDLIVGAGLTGLYQAVVSLNRGNEVTIIENTNKYGGQLRTLKYKVENDLFYFDIGPHIPPSSHSIWNNLCKEIDSINIPTPIKSRVKLKKDLDLLFPPSIKKNLEYLDIGGIFSLLKVVPTYLLRSVIKLEENNLEDLLINSWGDTFCMNYIKPLVRKHFKYNVSKISKKYILKVGAPKLKYVLNPKEHKFSSSYFYYPKYGVFEVIKSLKKKVLNKNCEVLLETNIDDINYKEKKFNITYTRKDDVNKTTFDRIFWSGSLKDLTQILNFKEKNKIRYRNLLTIHIGIKKKDLLGDTVHTAYITMPDILFYRIYEPKKCSPYMAPDQKTSACIEITLKKEKPKNNLDDLIEKALRQFRDLFHLNQNKITYLGHDLCLDAYPLLFRHYEEYVKKVKDKLPPNLFLIGRTGTYYPYSVDTALDTVKLKI